MNLKINQEVKDRLQEKGIPLKEGIPVLLSIYFGYNPTYIPKSLKIDVLSTNIVNIDYESNSYTWNVTLFEGQEEEFGWVTEFMDMFKNVNKDRRGLKSTALKRMKKLFSTYPDIRKDEVFEATREYINSVKDPMFIMTSHKFISNEQGEPLKDYIDELRSNKKESSQVKNNPFRRII